MTISQKQAAFLENLSFNDISESALESCKIVILDTIGVALGGSQAQHSRSAAALAHDYSEKKEATVFAYDGKTSCLKAAFANGVMAHAIDFDDDYEPGAVHVACAVIPAAFALAESRGESGKSLITAVTAGYEIACRAAGALALKEERVGYHITGAVGGFGSAAACGKLLKLEENRLVSALGIAGDQACGLLQYHFDGSMLKHLHGGKAAQNGLFSALLAERGFSGSPEIYEGGYGFYNVLFGGDYKAAELTDDLGQTFKISETSLKPYPSCRSTHSPIAAALILKKRHNLAAEDIDKITLRLFSRAYKSYNKPSPETNLQALLSEQFCVATALLRGEVTLQSFSPEALKDEKVRYLIRKIELAEDSALTDRFTKMRSRPIVLEILMKSGERFIEEVEWAPGSPANPMSEADRLKKFEDLAYTVLAREKMERLMDRLLNLERVENVNAVAELLH
ncbi:MAG: MmgE/PrpD family protein [Deltaproteobacteria bacterium]|nr:MAG: MmgE/PrpD family protein [Deltaproteobacteria bacterium]